MVIHGHVAKRQTRLISNQLPRKGLRVQVPPCPGRQRKEKMMAKGQNMKAIQEASARLEVERGTFNARIDGRIEGLREALRIQGGSSMSEGMATYRKPRRGDMKEAI